MSKSWFLIALVLFVSKTCFSQNIFDIVFPKNNTDVICQQYLEMFKQKPKEVWFSVERQGNELYFKINDKNWFDELFKSEKDGLAVDVVSKDIYGCYEIIIGDPEIKGELLKPIFAPKLKSGLESVGNLFQVHVGNIPAASANKELEFNILFLNNNNFCTYYWIYHLESYNWDLLDMGMYLDSLTYNPREIKPIGKEEVVIKNKTLKFKIPFKKNKSEYSQKDIKPIYDSLRLTNYDIKAIRIKAYSSIEGSMEKNIELQQLRAKSIASALQSFQKPTIKLEVSSSENWVEFFNDIKGTKHENLKSLTKEQLKVKLESSLSSELEPILKNHRKAVIELELEKKDIYLNMSSDDLLKKFNTVVSLGDVSEAFVIQNSIFEKMKDKVIGPEFFKKMTIPKQQKFVKIFNKNSAYRYMLDEKQSLIVYNELLELEKLSPKDREVKYNIAAIKIKLWDNDAIQIDEQKLKLQINALKNHKIHGSLIDRMMVNYHIIKAKNLMLKRDYENKDKSVDFINSHYNNFSLSDYDYLSLAQFFSHYGNTDMAVNLLEDKAKSIDISENLLFYYLNLTLIDNDLIQDPNYRIIMLNAINMNKERFCKLFNSIEKGGVTFQLLEDDYLNDTYCENCEN